MRQGIAEAVRWPWVLQSSDKTLRQLEQGARVHERGSKVQFATRAEAFHICPMIKDPLSRLLRAWLATAITDGLFSSVLSAVFYGSTVARLFQGVASTLLGAAALQGGTRTALIGVLMHFGVALGWSTVFLLIAANSSFIRRVLTAPYGAIRVAAVYGPCIWLVMSLVVIPTLLHRPPTINYRWWIQLIGHIPFVALPMVTMIRGGVVRSGDDD